MKTKEIKTKEDLDSLEGNMLLTENFSIGEFLTSEVADENRIHNDIPDIGVYNNLKRLATKLQEVRDHLEVPMIITSGYRCPMLNDLVGGQPDSDHLKGLAADFYSPHMDCDDIYQTLKEYHEEEEELGIDQVINETKGDSEWIHLSIPEIDEDPRNMFFELQVKNI